MNLEMLTRALMWSSIINYSILILWFVMFLIPSHDWIYALTAKSFKVDRTRFDEINLTGMVIYKMLVLMFNIIPWIVLLIVK